jgi:hypothetical protein
MLRLENCKALRDRTGGAKRPNYTAFLPGADIAFGRLRHEPYWPGSFSVRRQAAISGDTQFCQRRFQYPILVDWAFWFEALLPQADRRGKAFLDGGVSERRASCLGIGILPLASQRRNLVLGPITHDGGVYGARRCRCKRAHGPEDRGLGSSICARSWDRQSAVVGNRCVSPARIARRMPNCGAPTPTPVPLRIS